MAKEKIANIDNHVCIPRKEIIAHLDDPKPKEGQRIQEAIDICTTCEDLVKVLKENR